MTNTICTCIIILIYSFSYCQDQNNKAWIYENYQNCLKDSLPCECYSFNPPNFIYYNQESFIRIDEEYIIKNYFESDSITFDLIKRSLFIDGSTDSIQGKVNIMGDSMYINLENSNLIYVMVEDWIGIEDSSCLNYLNDQLTQNGYPTLNKVIKTDNLSCDCDIQFSISRVYDNKSVWIFERQNNFLYMYKWRYPKEIGWKSKKKLKRKFELKY